MPLMSDPATKQVAVTPSDSTVLECRALFVGTGGTVVVVPSFGATAVSYTNIQNGSWMPVNAYQVKAATTASGIIALY